MRIRTKLINDLSAVADGVRFTPLFPDLSGVAIDFVDESGAVPFFVKGPHSAQAVFYGSCPDGTVLSEGVEAISEQLYQQTLRGVRYKVPHRDGWVFDENLLGWVPPVPYPADGGNYMWDEENQSWVKTE